MAVLASPRIFFQYLVLRPAASSAPFGLNAVPAFAAHLFKQVRKIIAHLAEGIYFKACHPKLFPKHFSP